MSETCRDGPKPTNSTQSGWPNSPKKVYCGPVSYRRPRSGPTRAERWRDVAERGPEPLRMPAASFPGVDCDPADGVGGIVVVVIDQGDSSGIVNILPTATTRARLAHKAGDQG